MASAVMVTLRMSSESSEGVPLGSQVTVSKVADNVHAQLPAVMSTVLVCMHPSVLVTVRVYVPSWALVLLVIVGFCSVELNPSGPVHDQLAMSAASDVREMSSPGQTAVESAPAVPVGTRPAMMVTSSVPVHPSPSVTVTM